MSSQVDQNPQAAGGIFQTIEQENPKAPLGTSTIIIPTLDETFKQPLVPQHTSPQAEVSTLGKAEAISIKGPVQPLLEEASRVRLVSPPRPKSGVLAHVPNNANYFLGTSKTIQDAQNQNKSQWGFGFSLIRAGGALNFQGSLVVPKKITLMLMCNGAFLDFSRCVFVHPVTDVTIFSLCSQIRMIVPRGLRLENNSGVVVCGLFDGPDELSDNFPIPEAPILRIRGLTMCASTSVEINYTVNPMEIVQERPS